VARTKDPNSRSGKIRELIHIFPDYKNKDIAQITGESTNLISFVRSNMYKRRTRKHNVIEVQVDLAEISQPLAMQDSQDQDVNATQVGGQHYKGTAIQPWDYIISNNLGYLEGNVVKYISRWQVRGVEDLKKAQYYLTKLIEANE